MRRVKATQVQSHQPLYVDLDACPLIVRGTLHEKIDGRPERTLECTWLYFSEGLREAVNETPEELFALPDVSERGVSEPFPSGTFAPYAHQRGRIRHTPRYVGPAPECPEVPVKPGASRLGPDDYGWVKG